MPEVVHQLVATERALDKLAVRSISADEPTQLRHNPYVIVNNPRDRVDPGPTTWLIVTGWSATEAERRILDRR